MATTSPRVVGYARLSRYSDESASIAKQRKIISDTVANRDWTLVEIVEDVDVSATKRRLDRPGLDRVRRLVADGIADHVVVWKLDRLARSVADFSTLLDEGISVVSATEPIDASNSMGRAMAEMVQVFAGLEARTIAERTASGIAYRVSQGDRWRGGPTPYGYRSIPHPSGDGRTLEIEPSEAEHVRNAVRIVLDGGSLYRAMQVIDAAGSRPRRAAAWSLSSLRVVLTGDAILGRQTRQGDVLRDSNGLALTPWEPIVTLDESSRLREALAAKPLGHSRRKAARLLSGLLQCDGCGRALRVNSRRTKTASVESYGCRANGDGARCEKPVSVAAAKIEAWVSTSFIDNFGDVMFYRTIAETDPDAVDQLAAIQEALEQISGGLTDAEPGSEAQASLLERHRTLYRLREDARTIADTASTRREPLGLVRDLWEAASIEQRRTLLTAYVERIRVRKGVRGSRTFDPARFTITWAEPVIPASGSARAAAPSFGFTSIDMERAIEEAGLQRALRPVNPWQPGD
ncbi:recombinase family protein [Isoptericola sp. NPDC056573]|uniref:recombinase family protein n=1 Tax=Isoptericola sp. NPDC056573 TaxID=3345868 RepID=UPI00367A51EC